MNAMFDTLRFVHSLENEGISRSAAEAIAAGLSADRHDLATKEDVRQEIERLRQDIDKRPTKPELDAAIATAIARQTIQLGVIVGAAAAIIIASIGVIVSIH